MIASDCVLFLLLTSVAGFNQTKKEVWLMGHRGDPIRYPENTILSFQQAIFAGADVNEMDVQLTKDLVPVLFHDSTVDRTTNGTGPVSAYTFAELRTLDAGYYFTMDGGATYPYRGRGIVIPTMQEVCELVPGLLNADIKDHFYEAVDIFLKVIYSVPGCAERIITGSFDDETFRYIRRVAPELQTFASRVEVVGFTAKFWTGNAAEHQPRANIFEVPPGYVIDIAGYIAAANEIGMKIVYWTINDEDEMEKLLLAGADGLITDDVELAMSVYRRLGLKP